jgi:predicted HTH domain antitoxin
MKEITLKYPDNFELAVQTTPEELEAQIRLMAALKMFELGKLASGKAAELAGLSRVEFFEMCGRYRVSIFNYPPEDLEAELAADVDTIRQNSE